MVGLYVVIIPDGQFFKIIYSHNSWTGHTKKPRPVYEIDNK